MSTSVVKSFNLFGNAKVKSKILASVNPTYLLVIVNVVLSDFQMSGHHESQEFLHVALFTDNTSPGYVNQCYLPFQHCLVLWGVGKH